jgi:cob(I)alamin adenosyltransferase
LSKDKQRINRVTTRGGDRGETSLADGSRVAKSDPRIQAIGTVDELNSFIGLLVVGLRGADQHPELLELLARLQQELFDLGAYLATVGATPIPEIDWLDDAVENLNAQLPPLTEFVIPEAVARYLNRLSDLLFVMARLLNRSDNDDESQWRGLS